MALADGWHLVCPTVNAPLPDLGPGLTVWRWLTGAGHYVRVHPGAALAAGTGYWVFVSGGPVVVDTVR